MFELKKFHAPDFEALGLMHAPDCRFEPAPKDAVAPEGYHAMSI